jgi:hypothetical protein
MKLPKLFGPPLFGEQLTSVLHGRPGRILNERWLLTHEFKIHPGLIASSYTNLNLYKKIRYSYKGTAQIN